MNINIINYQNKNVLKKIEKYFNKNKEVKNE